MHMQLLFKDPLPVIGTYRFCGLKLEENGFQIIPKLRVFLGDLHPKHGEKYNPLILRIYGHKPYSAIDATRSRGRNVEQQKACPLRMWRSMAYVACWCTPCDA